MVDLLPLKPKYSKSIIFKARKGRFNKRYTTPRIAWITVRCIQGMVARYSKIKGALTYKTPAISMRAPNRNIWVISFPAIDEES